MTDDKILDYARRNAVLQGYPYLENGLQPVEDYIIDGVKHPGLKRKYEQHLLTVREVFAEWQQEQKTRWHVIRQAATVYYYASQLEEQLDRPIRHEALHAVKRYGVKEKEAKAAADEIYAWRSEAKDNKDEDYEIQLVQRAVEPLSQAGRPPEYDEPMMRAEFRFPMSLRTALQRLLNVRRIDDEDMSLNKLVIELLSNNEEVQRFQHSPYQSGS